MFVLAEQVDALPSGLAMRPHVITVAEPVPPSLRVTVPENGLLAVRHWFEP